MTRPPGLSFIGTFGLTLLAISGLFVADTFLAKVDRTENDVEAVRLFKEGQSLLQQGKNEKDMDRISDAIEIDRGNRYYQRTLARAELAAGRTVEAESTLAKLLETDSADGQASLLMAHVLIQQGRAASAVSYYHRAIYAHWMEDEEGNRRRARQELIDLLARQNAKDDLLGELLAVQEHAPQDTAARLRLGQLFLQAGSPARAMDVFRNILHDKPASADAYTGLGEAEFAEGNYRSAQRQFQSALHLASGNAAIQQKLDLSNQVLELDPTLRGLSAADRSQRSTKLLELALDQLKQCAPQSDLLSQADSTLHTRVSGNNQNDAFETDLDFAERLWQARKKECAAPPDANTPLALVLAKLTK